MVGDERYTIRVKDLRDGRVLDDEIVGAVGGATWDREGVHLYYTTVDESWRADKIWRHRLGTAQDADELVHHETDARFWVGIGRSRSDRFLMIASGSKTTSEYRVLDADHPEAGFRVFSERHEGLEYSLDHAVLDGRDRFLVLHNHTGADFELATAPAEPTGPEEWAPLVPHDPAVRLEDVDAFAGHLVVHQRSGGLTQLRILELGAGGVTDDYLVEFDEEVYTVGSGSNPGFEQPTVRLGYTSMAIPSSVYDYDVRTRELTLLKRAPVLGGYDPADYEEHRLWAPDRGRRAGADLDRLPARRPRHRRGAHADPGAPLRLRRLRGVDGPLLLRRPALAARPGRGLRHRARARRRRDGPALVRRGQAVPQAEQLLRLRRLRPPPRSRRAGPPRSAWSPRAPARAGCWSARSPTRRRSCSAGIVAGVPFVDALTTMLDATLPLTVTEYDEWGNPEADPSVYAGMRGYAPYDNVVALDYPPILAETSLNDTRVLYVEPAKWIAKLRATATGRRDFLLRTEMSAGHGGVSGRYKSWHDRAFALAWILDRMGLAGEARD